MNTKPFMILVALTIIFSSCKDKEVKKFYYESGELYKKGPYKDGKVDGILKTFYKNGVLKKKGMYKRGKADGVGKVFYKNGNLKLIEHWKNDQLHGKYKIFYPNGSLKRLGLFVKDSSRFEQAFKKDGSLKYDSRDVDVKLNKDTVAIGQTITINTRLYGRLKYFDSVVFGIVRAGLTFPAYDTIGTKDTIQFWGPNAKGEIVPSYKYSPALGESPLDSITYFSIVGNNKYNNGNVTPNKRGMKKTGERKAYQFQYTPEDKGFHCLIGYYRLIPKDPSFTKSPQAGAFPVEFYVKPKPAQAM